jgi:RNA polymerase sigma-70 factor (ECF subfamily)
VQSASITALRAPIIRRMRDSPADVRSDEQLMLDYGDGDAAAFARLYDRHERPVYRFLLRSLNGDAARADDLLQEVWMAVIRNAARYEPRAKFTTWLYGIVRTRLIDHWRALRRDISLDAANDDDSSDCPAPIDYLAAARTQQPEVQALSRAQAQAFVAAVEVLPVVQRETLLLHLEGELTLDEIAQLTGVGMETAKSRLRYALAKLRTALEDWR